MKGLMSIVFLAAAIVAMFFGYKSCQQGGSIADVMKDSAQGVVDTAKNTTGAAIDAAGKTVDVAKDAAGSAVDVAGDVAGSAKGMAEGALKALGEFFSQKLPSGVTLNIPKLGVENKLLGFIGGDASLDDKTWFNFDRINFDVGKATLSEKSMEQVNNIAEILKAYPNLKLKVGGYTDNTGSSDGNLQLSAARAKAVVATIVAKGVDASRLESEGFGSAHPEASNDTPEGRAKNRRIALRVLAK